MTIFKSPYKDVEIPELTINDFILQAQKTFKKPLSEGIAIQDGLTEKSYTFTVLNDRVNKFAVGLSKKGLKKGDTVGIILPNCTEFPVIFLGTLKIGGIVSTANPLNTEKELEFQFTDANVKIVITIGLFKEKALYLKNNVKSVEEVIVIGEDSYTTLFDNDGTDFPPVTIDVRNDPAVIPYSSGTMGMQKGVVLTHYNFVSNLLQVVSIETETMNEDAVFLGVLPFFHVYGMSAIMLVSLYVGAKMVVMPKFDLIPFLDVMQKYKITILHAVPPMILAFAKHPIIDKYDLSSLKVVISGAAPLGGDIQEAAANRLKCIVKQGYGMTELSPVSHLTPSAKVKKGTIGLLVPNMVAKIIDENGNEISKPYVNGELLVKGPNVMKEYLNNKDATSITIDKDGFLHTGDIAHVDEENYFYIVDRVKELIKYKGFQVPPAELEALLLTHPKIADCAVIGIPDLEAGELPKAFVVLKQNEQVTEKEIQDFVASKVAHYKKLRGGVEFIDQIPKSLSGKILRRTLKEKAMKK